jgi:putative oxidoreductase
MSLGLLVLRLALGVIFFAHGAQKVMGWWGGYGMDGFSQHVISMGMPAFMAYVAAYVELLGGAAVIFGFLTRLAALGLVGVMGVAIWKVHGVHGLFLNIMCAPDKGHGFEYALALLAMALCLVFTGAGKISLDGFIRGGASQS